MIYQRRIYPLLQKHLEKKQITVITGMRRTGKTTLLKMLIEDFHSPNKIYFDLERMDNRALFEEKNYENIVLVLKNRGLNFDEKILLAIDEIQLVPNAPSVIKYLYDTYNIKFIVSGSSTYYIKNLFSESLAGRKKVFELYTLNFSEFLEFKNIRVSKSIDFSSNFDIYEYERLKVHYHNFIKFGGFPEIVLAESETDKKDLLSDILNSYLNIDIKNISEIRDPKQLHKLLKMMAPRVCTRLDYTKLSSLTGISRPTIYKYLDLLEETFIIKRLPVFTKNRDREIVSSPKIFICDNGLLNLLAEVSSSAQFENAVYNQLKFYGKLQYYSLKSGKEIDFILNENIAIDVKETPDKYDKKQLDKLAEAIQIENRVLVGRNPAPTYNYFLWGGEIL